MDRRILLTIAAALLVLGGTAAVHAEDGWELSVGAGVVGAPVYEGSRDYYASPVPSIDVSWTKGGFSLSASILDGLGVMYVDEGTGILASASVNMGSTRERDGYSLFVVPVEHRSRTERLLEGTPDASGILAADATVAYITPIGLLGATAGYRPTRLDYPDGAGADETFHGLVYSLLYMIPLPVTDWLDVSAVALLEAMDGRYADAWYAVETATPSLDQFDAGAGLHRAQLVLDATAMITQRFGVSLMAAESLLLGDAGRSPYTEKRFQTSVVVTSFYSFGRGGSK
jgi:outer membrane scaffolding protein for murein synthesis (MipA/OmpV family)